MGIKMEQDEIINSHDMVNLFTYVPIKEALIIIGKRLRAYKSLNHCRNLTADYIMELLEFVHVSYNRELYKQIPGAPMGSLVSVVVSNLFMEDHEDHPLPRCLNLQKRR